MDALRGSRAFLAWDCHAGCRFVSGLFAHSAASCVSAAHERALANTTDARAEPRAHKGPPILKTATEAAPLTITGNLAVGHVNNMSGATSYLGAAHWNRRRRVGNRGPALVAHPGWKFARLTAGGGKGSNPAPSSGESANYQFRSARYCNG